MFLYLKGPVGKAFIWNESNFLTLKSNPLTENMFWLTIIVKQPESGKIIFHMCAVAYPRGSGGSTPFKDMVIWGYAPDPLTTRVLGTPLHRYKHSNGQVIVLTASKSIIFIPIVPISNGCWLVFIFPLKLSVFEILPYNILKIFISLFFFCNWKNVMIKEISLQVEALFVPL